MTSKKQCLPGPMYIWTPETGSMLKVCLHKFKPNAVPALRGEKVQPLIKKLFEIDITDFFKYVFSNGLCHWVYLPHLRTGFLPRSNWQTQNEFFVAFFFCLIGLLPVCFLVFVVLMFACFCFF